MPDKDAWSACSTNLGFALDAINMCLSASLIWVAAKIVWGETEAFRVCLGVLEGKRRFVINILYF